MGEKEEVTVEMASHCPKCDEIGVVAKQKAERHYIDRQYWDVLVYQCTNTICPWYNTGWVVSSNERGIVYQRAQGPRGIDKQFTKLSPDQMAMGRRLVEDIQKQDLRDE